jgi:hypothetical protein
MTISILLFGGLLTCVQILPAFHLLGMTSKFCIVAPFVDLTIFHLECRVMFIEYSVSNITGQSPLVVHWALPSKQKGRKIFV